MTAALVDTGFVVAVLDRDDEYHARSLAIVKDQRWSLLLPTATLVEIFHLRKRILRPYIPPHHMLVVITERLGFRLEDITLSDYRRISELLEAYADSGIDYVDAVVVAIAERYRIQHIMTLDQRDFRRYRPNFADHFILPIFDSY